MSLAIAKVKSTNAEYMFLCVAHREEKREATLQKVFYRRSFGYDSRKVLYNFTSLFFSEAD